MMGMQSENEDDQSTIPTENVNEHDQSTIPTDTYATFLRILESYCRTGTYDGKHDFDTDLYQTPEVERARNRVT